MTERKHPLLAVDALIFFPQSKEIVLIQRKNDPYKGYWALPGGFVEWGETVEAACLREVKEETSLDVEIIDLVGVFSKPDRDPRGHVVSIAFLCLPKRGKLEASSDARKVKRVDIELIKRGEIPLAFDHDEIIMKCMKKLRDLGLID